MNKKFLNAILLGALLLSSTGTFVGCKDYDDDIKDLQTQMDGKTSAEQLQSKVSELQEAINSAKTDLGTTKADADAAKAAAQDALTKANAALEAASGDAAKEAQAAQDVAIAAAADAAADAKKEAVKAQEAAIAAAEKKVNDLQKAVDAKVQALETAIADKASKADLDAIYDAMKALNTDAASVAAEISAIFGHRLTSVVRIPNTTLNDEPAILFRNITYVPQVFDGTHTAYTEPSLNDSQGNGEVTKGSGARLYIDNQETVAKYKVSPKMGVRASDIAKPFFMCDTQTNFTRAVDAKLAGKETPVAVAKYDLDASTGVLSVYVKKSVPASTNIDFEGGQNTTDIQKYYIASLNVPIAADLYTDAEKAAVKADPTNIPVVSSEYSRIAETTVVPMIKQAGSAAHVPHGVNYDRKELLNGKNAAGQYVHYHDSTSLYKSAVNELIDHKINWSETIDLKQYVTVCEFEKYFNGVASVGSHADMENYKSYGLSFRFALANKAYMQGTNQTDQQQFATIDSPMNGHMNSRVYTVNGMTETAVGREPIVRVMLVDTVRNNLVAQRYIKFQWTKTTKPMELPIYTFPNQLVTCKMHTQQFGTQAMNEDFYRVLADYGLTKTEFHASYKKIEITSLKKDGVEILKTPLDWVALDDRYNSNTGITVAQANAYAKNAADEQANQDVVFALAKDQDLANMSYNLMWYMSPEAVGTLKSGGSTYIITVKFIDESGARAEITKPFKQTITLPTQNFEYQGTYWADGAPGKIYKVNPSVYETPLHWQNGTPNWAYGAWTGWNTGKEAYNHIGADLVKGYISTLNHKYSPDNVDQFIQYIRSCAEVRFEFNDKKFADYAHLAGYKVTNDRQALWSNNQPELNPAELQTYSHPGTQNDARYDKLAATLWNKFGATAAENNKQENLPYKYNEKLGTGVNEAVSQLWLSEINEKDGSTAATKLIGKKVPMQLVVEYNAWNQVAVQDFELQIIDPLAISPAITENFLDAKVNGSYIDVSKGLSYTDWNDYIVSRVSLGVPNPNPLGLKGGFSQELWDYYQVRNVVFKTETSTTNLKMTNSVLMPTAGVKDGPLPASVDIKQVKDVSTNGATYTEVSENASDLRYFNDKGTPVNLDYVIFMDVQIRYKWGIKTSNVGINVSKSAGVDK